MDSQGLAQETIAKAHNQERDSLDYSTSSNTVTINFGDLTCNGCDVAIELPHQFWK